MTEKVPKKSWCAIYTRQSRSSDAAFSSCEAQLSECLRFTMSRVADGWVWNGRRYDDEGQSSETLDRPGMQRLLEDIRQGEVDRVVVHRLDRLSRRISDSAALLQEFRDRQIALTIVTQPELDFGPQQTLILHLMASFAEFERELTRERLAEARAAHKRRGRRVAGVVPYGYLADPITKQLVVEHQEARRVRKMFLFAAQGETPRKIAEIANRRGWRTRHHVANERSGQGRAGGRWTPRQVLATLANPTYAGLIRNGDGTLPGQHEAIVDAELFEKARQQVEARRGRSSPRRKTAGCWLLGGLLRCGQCRRPMSPATSGYRNIAYRYYRCRSHTGGKPPCRGVSAPAHEVEQFVLDMLGKADTWQSTDGLTPTRKEHGSQFAAVWSCLDDAAQRELVGKLVEQVEFDARGSAISVTLDAEAIQRLPDARARTCESAG